jgi:hypothetical protein
MPFFKKRKISPSERMLAHEMQGKRDQLFDAERRSAQVQNQLFNGLGLTLKKAKARNIWRNTLLMVKPNSWLSLLVLFLVLGAAGGFALSAFNHPLSQPAASNNAALTPTPTPTPPPQPQLPAPIAEVAPLLPVPVAPDASIPSVVPTQEEMQLRLSYSLSQPTN